MGLKVTLSIDFLLCHYAKCQYAKCHRAECCNE